MNRILTYTVPALPAPVRISTFLRQKGFSRQNLIELKKHEGSVTIGGLARYFNERLYGGETVIVTIPVDGDTEGKFEPVSLPLSIVYEDEDLLVVNKPAGMPVHPSHGNRGNTLANALSWYFQEKGEPFLFRCSNRLDRDTSGLTLVARHFVSGNMLSIMGTNRQIKREYLGIVRGVPAQKSGTIDAPLSRADGSVLIRKVDFAHGERAVTHYRTIESRYLTAEAGAAASADSPAQFVQNTGFDSAASEPAAMIQEDIFSQKPCGQKVEYSLVSFTLETGRTHQIRVHMKYLGSPLIGDYLYNPDYALMHRQALHCAALSFSHPITGKPLHFTAPLPQDMARIFSDCSAKVYGNAD